MRNCQKLSKILQTFTADKMMLKYMINLKELTIVNVVTVGTVRTVIIVTTEV